MPTSLTSMLTALFLLFSPTQAWLATEYIGEYVASAAGENFTRTGTVLPASTVTPYSTSTFLDTVGGDQLTVIQLLISGINPTPTQQTFIQTSFISTSYYAPATITQPPTCTGTKFSYVTNVPVDPPTIMIQPPNSVNVTSSTAYSTTTYFLNADGQTTSSSAWSEIDYYLQTGQLLPTLPVDTDVMLNFCQDPRGCYLGNGAGCTASAGGVSGILGGLTESNGPPSTTTATATGKSSSTASASGKKNAAGKVTVTGGNGLWVCVAVSVASLIDSMIL